MSLGLIGLKVGMTQVYDESGKVNPVTVLALGPCPVLQIRTADRDGNDALQIGLQDKSRQKATRAERGHVAAEFSSNRRRGRQAAGIEIPAKADCEPQRHIREFRLEEPVADVEVGKMLTVEEVFKDVSSVDVIGTSKGRGYAGVMKRHGFAGLKASHGVKKVHRSGGSISSHAADLGGGRPKKGHKAAGQYGNARKTIRNLKVVRVDGENHVLLVKGAVPGPNGGFIMVRPTNKKG